MNIVYVNKILPLSNWVSSKQLSESDNNQYSVRVSKIIFKVFWMSFINVSMCIATLPLLPSLIFVHIHRLVYLNFVSLLRSISPNWSASQIILFVVQHYLVLKDQCSVSKALILIFWWPFDSYILIVHLCQVQIKSISIIRSRANPGSRIFQANVKLNIISNK